MAINLVFTTTAYAQEKITCSMKSTGGWAGCNVDAQLLTEDRRYEQSTTVSYSFTCSPGKPDRFKIGVAFDNQEVFFRFGDAGQIHLIGTGALRLIDETSGEFERSVFKPGCSLVISAIDVSPTDNQIEKWREDVIRHDTLMTQEKSLQNQLISLSTLNSGFDILLSLIAALDASLRQQNNLILRVKSGEVTQALLEIADNAQDVAKAKALRTLVKQIERVRVDDSTEDVLSRSLSAADLALIRAVKKPDPDEIRTNIDASIVRETTAEQALWSICQNGANFVSLPVCDVRYPGVDWKAIP